MKILGVNPGSILFDGRLFVYSVIYDRDDGKHSINSGAALTSTSAKQAMREKVAFERKRHGLMNEGKYIGR